MPDFDFSRWDRFRLPRKPDRYIIAYGSNLDLGRMESRPLTVSRLAPR